jgi:hypothetical protein
MLSAAGRRSAVLSKETNVATYAFMNPVLPSKAQAWKDYVREMTTTRKAELQTSRKRIGLTKEEVWLQHTPMGDFAVVYWEAPDIGKVFQALLTSQDPFDKWFREKVLVEVHGMKPTDPPPPLNEKVLG